MRPKVPSSGFSREYPKQIFDQYDTEVLVIDDSSKDRTFETGLRSAADSEQQFTILSNSTNQGYGGNQKLGYQYALRNRFDFVVLLHGDGQYAPESIPSLLAPLAEGRADAVLGSRMLTKRGALSGGMPFYKFIGNKILTYVQNLLLRSNLSEFHSGFRAYRVSTLARLPFQYNSNVFHFDTEIIIQLLATHSRIVEVPIPTYYGDEICRVNGIRYAKDVVLTTIASCLHGMNLFYDRKFDVQGPGNTHYRLKLGYASSHTAVFDAIPQGAQVLDIGCGPGEFAALLSGKGCSVLGADQFPPVSGSHFKEFFRWREGEEIGANLHDCDFVLLLDIVEHLKQPEAFLDTLRRQARSLNGRPKFIVTTGNVVFCVTRMQAFFGNFNYGKRGILDLTHTRLYTFATLKRLFQQSGFQIEEMRGIPAPFPEAIGNNAVSRLLVHINSLLIRISKGLFSYQIFLVAAPTATVDAILDETISESRARVEAVSGTHDRLAAVRTAR